jgi:nucleotide-binding universal stress UspA family protein
MTPAELMQSQRQAAQPRSSLKTIVVATDFSENATAALDWATDLARAHAAQIVLVHAVDTELPALAGMMEPIGTYVRQKLETGLKHLTASHVPAQTEYDLGKPWSVIATVAREAKADLIVVGAHGKSKFHVLGPVADRLIRTTSIPVLVHRTRAGAAPGVRTVLAATDFSEEAALAMEAAVRLLGGSMGPARLVLFHAVPLLIIYTDLNMPMAVPTYWDETERAAATRLEALAAALRSDRFRSKSRPSAATRSKRSSTKRRPYRPT